jgi:hypothetical protein
MANNEWFSNYLIQNHPESYASRGWAFTGAQPNRGRAMASMFFRTASPGSSRYAANLEDAYMDVARRHGGVVPPKIEEKFISAEKSHMNALSSPKRAFLLRNAGKIAGPLLSVGMAGYAFASTEGGLGNKTFAAGTELGASAVGWGAGLAGAKIGGAIGSAFGPVGTVVGGGIGLLAGALGGYTVASSAAYSAYDFADRMVENQKRKRGLEWNEWAGQTQAFNTQRAVTMRQRSLEAMNRGMMNSRSLMGREAGFMHR